jgi:SpoVK/Ycf46/Vps4 family AAA+-type ATPase
MRYIYFFILILSALLFANDSKKKKSDSHTDIQQADVLLSRISSTKVLDLLITNAKKELIQDIIEESKKNSENLNSASEDHYFIPKEPQSLLSKESYKNKSPKLTIHERIAEKYMIKDMPGHIKNIVGYYSNHAEMVKSNTRIFNRILLHGKPGVGKSHLVKVLADELEIPMLSFSASFFADKYIGESSRRIRKAFEVAKKHNGPIFIFIDEIDALTPKRTENMHQEHRSTLMTLLTELQELQDNPNVYIFTATNDIDVIDAAMKDRFAGSVCEIKPLEKNERAGLIKRIFSQHNSIIDNTFASRLAEVMQDFSNRELQFVIITALLKQGLVLLENKDDKKHLAHYIKQAIVESGKKGSFAFEYNSTYSDGI